MGLSITVQKGHDFSSGNVTRAALNAGATPTIAITGSVGASEIAASSINDAQIKDDADILVAKLKLAHNNIVIGGSDNNASVLAPNSAGLESTNNDVEGNVGFLCDDGAAFSILRTDLNTAGGHVGIKKTGGALKLIINTGIVDGNHLASSVFDGETVERNNAAIRVKDGGISVTKLKAYKDSDDNVKSGFLTYGVGGTAKVLESTGSSQVALTGGANGDFSLKTFNKVVPISTTIVLDTWMTGAHGITTATGTTNHPHLVAWYYECTITEQGYAVGDRVYDVGREWNPSIVSHNGHYVDGSNVGIYLDSHIAGLYVRHKTSGAKAAATAANWKIVAVVSEF
jgi:hypothetical protein